MSHFEISPAHFHLGFLLSTALLCGTVHLMMIIVEPDFKDAEIRSGWLNGIKSLQFFMFLPLGGYLFSNSDQGPEVLVWFFISTITAALMYVPILAPLKGEKPTAETFKDVLNSAQKVDSTKISDSKIEIKNHLTSEDLQNITSTHMRILFGNFALGLLMGASLVLPFIGSILVAHYALKAHFISDVQYQTIMKFIPGVCCVAIPVIMPLSFLLLGPALLRITQNAKNITNADKWKERWTAIQSKSTNQGHQFLQKITLLELPWKNAGFKHAFYIGVLSKFNPFTNAIFVTEGIDELLSESEVRFVLAHEAAHGVAKHSMRRLLLGFGLFMMFVTSQVMALFLQAPILSLALAVGCFLWGYNLMNRQGELQEFEADIMAISLLNGDQQTAESAISALQKLDQYNVKMLQPATEKRISYIRALYLAQDQKTRSSDSDDSSSNDQMAA